MPRVPTYDNFQTAPNALPQTQLRSPDMPDVAGAQLRDLSQNLGRAGDAAGRIALDMQTEANQLRVDDAINRAKEAALKLTYDKDLGFTNQRGINALERSSGKPLADEYTDTLRDQVSQIAEGLGNDAQKQAFAMRSNDVLTSFRGSAIKHEADQFREYARSVREGTISNRMNEIGLNYNNPQVIDEAVTSIRAATYDQARLLGRSAEWAEAQARKMTSNAHKVALSAALEKNDIGYADAYLKKYAKDMDADDILRAQGLITKEMDSRIALTVASDVMRRVSPRIVTSDADRAFNVAIKTESGGRQFAADGKTPLTSPKGAIGVAQVMPTTAPEAAKLAGLPWDEQRYKTDAAYNEALGRAYFQRQLQDFGGNLSQAYAAYNAGPGATREAIKKAETAEKGLRQSAPALSAAIDAYNAKVTSFNAAPTAAAKKDIDVEAARIAAEKKRIESLDPNWLAYLPKETQDYVAKNIAAYGAGEGQYQRPTLQDVHDAVRAKTGTTSPQRLKLALDEATRQYEDAGKAIKQREDEGVANAMRAVIQNGGRFSDLPISVRAAIPAKEVDNVMNFAQRIAKGDNTTNLALYQKLATDQNYLRNLSDNDFFRLRSQLNESDFKHFAAERTNLLTGQKGNPAEDLNTQAINAVLADRLHTLDIDPTPKDGSSDAMRVGALRKFVRESILASQSVAGKKFTDAEVEKHIDGLFAKSQDFRTTFLGIGTGKTSQRLLTMAAGDIPGEIKDKLKADFKAAGVPKPTDADLLGAYWQLKFAKP